MLGLETALGLVITNLVEPGHLSVAALVERMSTAPARLLGLDGQGSLAEGSAANVTVFDPAAPWTVDAEAFHSKSRNTPFGGMELRGKVSHVFYRGTRTVSDGRLMSEALV
jgi:dihydroorotase